VGELKGGNSTTRSKKSCLTYERRSSSDRIRPRDSWCWPSAGSSTPVQCCQVWVCMVSVDRTQGPSRPRLLIAVSPSQHTSQLVTGDSESSRDLMRHRRPVRGPTADGGAHGPAHGSPPAASARIVRSDQIRPTSSDRGVRPSGADGTAHEPTADTQRCAASQSRVGDRGETGR
jgi:hypothetical protein